MSRSQLLDQAIIDLEIARQSGLVDSEVLVAEWKVKVLATLEAKAAYEAENPVTPAGKRVARLKMDAPLDPRVLR